MVVPTMLAKATSLKDPGFVSVMVGEARRGLRR
jgi:hypothetical protein